MLLIAESANGTGRKTDATLTRVHKASCPTINGGEDSAFTTSAYSPRFILISSTFGENLFFTLSLFYRCSD
jgi:hypothetical protein